MKDRFLKWLRFKLTRKANRRYIIQFFMYRDDEGWQGDWFNFMPDQFTQQRAEFECYCLAHTYKEWDFRVLRIK